MTSPTRGLLDTSVFIAAESGRPLNEERVPDEAAISVVTLAELQAGVLVAADVETRARRMTTLDAVADVELIEVDEAAALMWARMRVHLAQAGRRVNVNDLWIAASAASRGLPVVTQDDDFDAVVGVGGLEIIRV
ncbi:type II toxin-antitoxin system VapC family toxin [Pseudonocardia sp. 73-21]|uniref:type II toxin-antitoxin system VapC family toxin n=1 Tax=Pseudonocardia sp. 73-21 TaxID=1895809 RepID=UPI0009610AE8|nr:type II toxin-antitoxin system VapC family toxin [Pseudonocardia sp. 73-21]OJY47387.1 MAG: VapC toxin family PIN domain ribonuclease [Pseudonocardia sp. 73-21]